MGTSIPPCASWTFPGKALLQRGLLPRAAGSYFCPPPPRPSPLSRVHTGLFPLLTAASSVVPTLPQVGASCVWCRQVPASPSYCSPGTTPGNRIWYGTLSCIYFSFRSRGWGACGSLYSCQYVYWTKLKTGEVFLFCEACKMF